MGIRKIRTEEDEILRKISKPVTDMGLRNRMLVKDMYDTMYKANGVGLAGPQVGILKRLFVIDCGENPMTFINPEILETEGEQTDDEGCLSLPGKHAQVTRAMKVKVKALNEDMQPFVYEAEGLEARCILHENDHLDGVLYIDRAEGPVLTYSDEEDGQ